MTLTTQGRTAAEQGRNRRLRDGFIMAIAACVTLAAVTSRMHAQPTLPTASIAPYPGSRSADEIVRTTEYRADVIGWVALGRVLWSSGLDQAFQSPDLWPRTSESYGRRLLTRSAQLATIETVRHGVAAAMERDPAYVKCDCDGFGPRMGQVLKSMFTDFDTAGRRRIGWPRFAGALAGSFVLGQLQPGQGSAETVAFRALTTAGGSVIGNSVKEFGLIERMTGGSTK
jgi:hypothetical protein